MENGPLIVDLPINSMVMFHSYVSFSKGTFTQPNQKTGQVDSPGKLEHLRSLLNDWEHVSWRTEGIDQPVSTDGESGVGK